MRHHLKLAPECSLLCQRPLTHSSLSPHRSLLNNSLGEGADAIVSSAFEMPQIMTLCGIQPEQTDIDFSRRGLDAADAKLLAFDLSKNRTVKTVKYAAARKRLLFCVNAR